MFEPTRQKEKKRINCQKSAIELTAHAQKTGAWGIGAFGPTFFRPPNPGEYGNNGSWLLGSRHFAKTIPSTYRPDFAVLLDMIGDRDLTLSRDYYSTDSAPLLWGKIVSHCASLGIPVSVETIGVLDDHVPLIKRGIRAVDLIDFDYPSWHTVADTPDKCSPESLGKIGGLLLKLLYEK